MSAPSPENIAIAYRTTRQTVARISARFGLSNQDWRHPEKIFAQLRDRGFSHPLVDHIADPQVQSWIHHQLMQPTAP